MDEKLKELGKIAVSDLNDNQEFMEYISKPENICLMKVDRIRTRSKYKWYEHGEKS